MDHCCPSTDSLHTCPLRTFCCIITSAQYPFRILHLDNDALDLFIANSEDHECQDRHEEHTLDRTLPFAPHHPYHHQQSDFARIQAMAFIKGRSMLDVLLPDPAGTILGSSPTSTTSSSSSSSSSPENNTCTIQPFVIAEDAILVEDSSDLDVDDEFSTLHQQLKPIRRVHVCVHTISSIPSLPSLPSKFSAYRRNNLIPTKYRCYALKDVTEMHGLATASRLGIRASGRHLEPAQTVLSRALPPAISLSSTFSTSSTLTCTSTSLSLSSTTATSTTTLDKAATLAVQSTNSNRTNHRDSGIMLQDQVWGSQASPFSSISTCITSSTSFLSSSSAPSQTPKAPLPFAPLRTESSLSSSSFTSNPPRDTGLLLLQVTCFGTIDHAYATQSLDPNNNESDINNNNKKLKREDVGLLFMAQQQKTTIETMANNSVMAYAHPSDLRALCRGLDLVCKELYSVFIVRWRIDGRGAFEEGVFVSDVEEETKGEVTETAHGFSKAIEYQDEIFEEWEDHTVVPEDCFPFSQKSSSNATTNSVTADEFAWTEITGVLSNGTPLLVVRPMTQPEVDEYRRLQAESEEEARVPASHEMDARASPFELERVSCRPRYLGESEDESDWYDLKEVSSADETVMVPSSASSTTSLSSPSTLSSISPSPDSAMWKLQTRKKEMHVEGSHHTGAPRVCSDMSIVPLSPTSATCSSHNSSLVLASRTSAYAQCCPNPMMHGRMSSVSSTSSVSRQRPLRPAVEHHNSSSIPRPMRLPTFSLTIGLPFVPLLSRVPFVPTTMTTTRTYSTSGTISLPAIALQAWRQWCEVMHRGQDQLCAWCEYVLEMMTAQVAHGVSRGLTMLGWQDGPLDICCPTTSLFGEYDSYYARKMEEQMEEQMGEQVPPKPKAASEVSPPQPMSSSPFSKSGLHRAGKVLLTEYPTLITPLNNKLQTLGGSWLGQKVLTRSRGGAFEQTLDSVADQVVDWYESEAPVTTALSTVLATSYAALPIPFKGRWSKTSRFNRFF
ncbi:hypothetical protein CPB97_000809 [Podila verticillata]|nr:hypothetical protein CPB97_000809 [Podila verticillata]